MQRDRNEDPLEDKRDRRCHEKVRRGLDVGLPGHRQRENDGLQREDVEKRVEAVLIEQHEADEHEAAGEQMGKIEAETLHQRLPETKRSKTARNPSISATPTKSGTRKTRILAIVVSNSASSAPATASLTIYASTPIAWATKPWPGSPTPQRTKTQQIRGRHH